MISAKNVKHNISQVFFELDFTSRFVKKISYTHTTQHTRTHTYYISEPVVNYFNIFYFLTSVSYVMQTHLLIIYIIAQPDVKILKQTDLYDI